MFKRKAVFVSITVTRAFLLLFTCLPQSRADFATESPEAFQLYQKGSYAEAIEILSKATASQPKDQAHIAHWKGLCLSRIQSFEQAISAFQEAIKLGGDDPDLNYELGQALYATQQLKLAREAFRNSVAKGYKTGTSTYYIGFIEQILENYRSALKEYRAILRLKNDPERVKQAALLQIAQLRLNLAQENKHREDRLNTLINKVIPFYKRVADYDPHSVAGVEANAQLTQIQQEVAREQSTTFQSGVPIPLQNWVLRVSEDLRYDTNVVTKANDSILQISNAGSYFSRTNTYARYDFNIKRSWVISPEVDISYTKYSNQTEPFSFQNDNLNSNASLKARYEHTFFKLPAAFNFNSDFNYFMRDWQFNHSLPFYSRFYNFTLSERLPLFSFGGTTFSAGMKLFSSQDGSQNALNPTVSITQNFQLNHGGGLSLTLMTDYNRARNAFYDRRDYRATTGLSIPHLIAQFDLFCVFDITFVDNINQRATRGIEKTISPSLILSRTFMSRLTLNLNYAYITNLSDDQQLYAFSKHLFGIGFGYQL